MPHDKPIKTRTVGDLTVSIFYDTDPINPREDYSQLCEILYISSRYTLGDKQVSSSEITDRLADPLYFSLRVNAYIHSGVTVSLSSGGQYSDPWDGGCCGIISVKKSDACKEFSHKRWNQHTARLTAERMASEIKEFDYYLQGFCYGFTITDPDDEELDSCWGFLGDMQYCIDAAMDNAAFFHTKRTSTALEQSIQLTVGPSLIANGAD